jgi:hypothetical protein
VTTNQATNSFLVIPTSDSYLLLFKQQCVLCSKRHTLITHLRNIDRAARKLERLIRMYEAANKALLNGGTNDDARRAALRVARNRWNTANGEQISNRNRANADLAVSA